MVNSWLVRYGEIALKGANRPYFEGLLVRNIKDCLKKNRISYSSVLRVRGRIIVFTDGDCGVLKDVFGITSISPASAVGLADIESEALKYFTGGSFRVTAQRISKEGLESSQQINERVGGFIVGKTGAKVRLKAPDVDIGIEVVGSRAYVFNRRVQAVGGLPLGCEGRVAVLLEDKNSLRAAYFMMRRGCRIVLVGKKKLSYGELEKYSYGAGLKFSDRIPDDVKAVVVSETVESIRNRKFKQVVLRPLL